MVSASFFLRYISCLLSNTSSGLQKNKKNIVSYRNIKTKQGKHFKYKTKQNKVNILNINKPKRVPALIKKLNELKVRLTTRINKITFVSRSDIDVFMFLPLSYSGY